MKKLTYVDELLLKNKNLEKIIEEEKEKFEKLEKETKELMFQVENFKVCNYNNVDLITRLRDKIKQLKQSEMELNFRLTQEIKINQEIHAENIEYRKIIWELKNRSFMERVFNK